MRYALIEDNIVANTIEADGPEVLPGLTLLEALPTTAIGDVLVDGVLPQPESMPEPDPAAVLAAVQESALFRIDAMAEAERAKYITPGSGQALVYQRKLVEAGAALSGDAGPFPHLEVEIGVTAPTLEAVAQSILSMEENWVRISAALEGVRLTTKALVRNSTNVDEVKQVMDSLHWPNF